MTLADSLLATSDAFIAARNLSRSRLATLIFNDGKTLDRIARGGDLTTRSYEKAMSWFDTNWPADLAWPAGVTRPVAQAVAE